MIDAWDLSGIHAAANRERNAALRELLAGLAVRLRGKPGAPVPLQAR